MANETMRKFGYPDTLVRDYDYWVVLLRPAQVTLGSLVLAAKSESTAFGRLPAEAYTELANVTAEVEATLAAEIGYQRINYLMLMMVDPNVHFHIFPRYEEPQTFENVTIQDLGWPGPPDLKSGQVLDAESFEWLRCRLSAGWLTNH